MLGQFSSMPLPRAYAPTAAPAGSCSWPHDSNCGSSWRLAHRTSMCKYFSVWTSPLAWALSPCHMPPTQCVPQLRLIPFLKGETTAIFFSCVLFISETQLAVSPHIPSEFFSSFIFWCFGRIYDSISICLFFLFFCAPSAYFAKLSWKWRGAARLP